MEFPGDPNENWSFCENETYYATFNHINLYERFVFLGIVGGTVSVLGILFNISLLFLIHAKHTSLFVEALAFFDIGMCVAFQCVIALSIAAEYTGNMVLIVLVHQIMRPMYLFGTSMKAGQTYLIICASLDRYIMVRFSYMQQLQDNAPQVIRRLRLAAIYIVLLVSFFQKVPKYFEIEIVENKNCTGFAHMYSTFGIMLTNAAYLKYKKYFHQFIDVYLPFLIMIVLNFMILHAMNRKRSGSILLLTRMFNMDCYRNYQRHMQYKQRKLREATYTLIAITSGYLISNTVNLCVMIIEQTNPVWLDSRPALYTALSDASSFLVLATCSSRIVVYYFCNSQIRLYIRRCLCRDRVNLGKHEMTLMSIRRKHVLHGMRRCSRKPTWVG